MNQTLYNILKRILLIPILGSSVCIFLVLPSTAQTLIRDAEIEEVIGDIAMPIFKSAGLDPNFVKIHILLDDEINAFVAKGQRVFLNVGLILSVKTPEQLLGVIAHETAHISGGHLAKTQEALKLANAKAIAGLLMGAATIAAGGNMGGVAILGGQQIGRNSLLSYSRNQEVIADILAVNLMDKAGYSGKGLIEFLEILAHQENLIGTKKDPYSRTHPLFPERLEKIKNSVESLPNFNKNLDKETRKKFWRAQSKLFGYIKTHDEVLEKYPLINDELPSKYARAVNYNKYGQLENSLKEISSLLKLHPNDPFFHEFLGQTLLENGQIYKSIDSYKIAKDLKPNQPQILCGLASAQVATGKLDLLPEAIKNLQMAVSKENDFIEAWRMLAIAHGRNGEIGLSSLASAEQHMLLNNYSDSLRFANQSISLLKKNTPGWLRAKDIELILTQN